MKKSTLKTIAFLSVLFLPTSLFMGCSDDDAAEPIDDGNSGSELVIDNYIQIATGQTVTYDDEGDILTGLSPGDEFYGQDAHYLKGATMSYTDNGDGTITDDNTGLMWEQAPLPTDYSWQEAVDHCDDLELAGHDDWRVPSAKELFSISNFGTGWPYLDRDYFTLASGEITKVEQYWTSNYYVGETVEGDSSAAFGVNHVTGHIKAYRANASDEIGGKYVRAVRGGDYGVNEFVDNGDGTVTDNASGLMWTQDDSGEGLDWEQALAYAESSTFAGNSDWRLPNVKELQGIVDYGYSPSATDASLVGPAIDPMFSCTPIINEAGNDDYAYYWTGTSAKFSSNQPYYYAWYVAFGRAVDPDGEDSHGAGAVRFYNKVESFLPGEGGERYYNYVRLVRSL
ncbi:MAG: DUF1566 domain-containing protein [Cyclobacteriaceae bacterium]